MSRLHIISLNLHCNPMKKVQLSPFHRFINWGLSVPSLLAISSEDFLQIWKFINFSAEIGLGIHLDLLLFISLDILVSDATSLAYRCAVKMQRKNITLCARVMGVSMVGSDSGCQTFSPWPFLKLCQTLTNKLNALFVCTDYVIHMLFQFKR